MDPIAPGVHVREDPSGVRTITGAGTSTPAFLGRVQQGPAAPTLVRSHQDFSRTFSPAPSTRGELVLAEAVYGFFANGGTSCYIVPLGEESKDKVADLRGEAAARTGLAGLATVPDVSMVAVPEIAMMDEDRDQAIQTLVEHCKDMGNRMAILDAPEGVSAEDLPGVLPELDEADALFGAVYYPWVTVPGIDGTERTVPPCGHVAGVWARSDLERGVHRAPANAALTGVLDLASDLSDKEHMALARNGINSLRTYPGRGHLVWGARTMANDNRDWHYLNVRRYVCFLADSIRQSSAWAVFEPTDERLWSTLRGSIESFLADQWRQGALQGRTPEEAFYVACDHTNNDPAELEPGLVTCDIGIAPVRPAEFIHFTITQTVGQEAGTEQ